MIAAFFDMDETLIRVNSGKLWVRRLWEQGELSRTDLLKSLGYIVGYRLAIVDMNSVAATAVSRLQGTPEARMRDDVLAWFDKEIRHQLIPEMKAKVEFHRDSGHKLVLLTASSPYVAGPMADLLNLDDFLCSRFVVDADGQFTGELDGPFCYGQGKVHYSEAWAHRHQIDLEASFFYTDSYTDLPMLQRVGNPIAVNPDPRLRRHARRAGYTVVDFA